jgi:hypothetical protein
MSTVLTSGQSNSGNFTPHPDGTFMAVCCDVFTKEMPNKYKGQTNQRGQVDTRETITKVCISFLTEETIEIEGQIKPRYASYWGTATLGTPDYPSNVRKFIKAWFPKLTDEHMARLVLDQFVGKPAYLTITHSKSQDGKVWANVTGAMQPPKGANVPAIPADFTRHNDKDAAPAPAQQAAPVPAKAADEDDLPF